VLTLYARNPSVHQYGCQKTELQVFGPLCSVETEFREVCLLANNVGVNTVARKPSCSAARAPDGMRCNLRPIPRPHPNSDASLRPV